MGGRAAEEPHTRHTFRATSGAALPSPTTTPRPALPPPTGTLHTPWRANPYRRHPPPFAAALHHPHHPSVAAAAAAAAAFHAGHPHPHAATAAELQRARQRARHHAELIAEHYVGAGQQHTAAHPHARSRHVHAPRTLRRRGGGGGGGGGRPPPAAFGAGMPQAHPFVALPPPVAPGAAGPAPAFYLSPLPDTPYASLLAAARELAALQAYAYHVSTRLRELKVVGVPPTVRGALDALAAAAEKAARTTYAATELSRAARVAEAPVDEGGLMEMSVGGSGGVGPWRERSVKTFSSFLLSLTPSLRGSPVVLFPSLRPPPPPPQWRQPP